MDINIETEKKIAAYTSVFSNIFLIAIKLVVGIISGSISIISEAIHSASDLFASIITFLSVKESSKPADDDHQFGHDKYEDISSLIESLIIMGAAFYIIYAAIKNIIFPPKVMINTGLGLYIMGLSIIIYFFVSSYILYVAKKSNSNALHADGIHLRTDIYSALGVFVGLAIIKVTNNPVFDPIVAIIVAIIIFITGLKIYKKAQTNLLDASLDKSEIDEIKQLLAQFSNEGIIALKQLKTRRSGFKKNMEIILIVNGRMQIKTAHILCDKIEQAIEEKLHHTEISIHLEPQD